MSFPRWPSTIRLLPASLRGAGRSECTARLATDKTTMATDIHGLLTQIGHAKDIRLVGHDIGLMVAFAYAAAYPEDVVKLVLSEAFVPDPAIYTFPALSADGPGPWHFGFFLLDNGFAEQVITGNEEVWVDRFIDAIEAVKGAVTPTDIAVYAEYLRQPGHLRATLEVVPILGPGTWSTTLLTRPRSSRCRYSPSAPMAAWVTSSRPTPRVVRRRCHRYRRRELGTLDLRGVPREAHANTARLPQLVS